MAQDIRILVVADDQLVRAGLAALLAAEDRVTVVGQEMGLADLTTSLKVYQPDAIVWDFGWEPEAAMARLEEAASNMPIITLLPDGTYAAETVAAGARGVLLRDRPAEAIAAALAAIAQGLIVTDPAFAVRNSPTLPGPQDSTGPLTPRELEVVRLLARGLPNKAIADALGVSEHTVKFHVASIMSKLGAQSRTEAVVLATRAGLIPL